MHADIDDETGRLAIRATLARIWLGAAVAFAFFVVFAFFNHRPVYGWFVAVDVATAIALLATARMVRHNAWPLTALHGAGYALAAYCGVHAMVSTLLFHDPSDARFVAFLVLGIGAVAYSVRTGIVLMLVLAIGGVLATRAVGPSGAVVGSLVWMVTSMALAIPILLGRMTVMREATQLRAAERERSRELASTLSKLETELVERKKAEAEREAMAAQLRQAQKMEAIGTLAGGIAHDLNNVLASISGVAEVARDDLPEGSPLRSDFGLILAAAGRGASLTANLLGFARRGKIRHVRFSLAAVVAEVVALLGRTVKKSVRFTAPAQPAGKEPGGSEVVGDPGQISQALMNLCLNAAEAIAGSGTVAVEINRLTLLPGESAVLAAGGDYFALSVTDDGAGMDEVTLSRAFEPFFTSKSSSGHNSGLGLAMTYGTMREHHGEALLRSRPGEGTKAILRFPIPQAPAVPPEPTAPVPASKTAVPAAGRALIIDDEPMVRITIRRQLQAEGLATVEALGGAEGAALFAQDPGSFSIVMLDLAMPGMNGAECFVQLRKLDPGVPIVLVSGYPRDQDVESLLAMGNAAFLPKPFGRTELVALVRQYLRARRR